jgi:hypothetical protein
MLRPFPILAILDNLHREMDRRLVILGWYMSGKLIGISGNMLSLPMELSTSLMATLCLRSQKPTPNSCDATILFGTASFHLGVCGYHFCSYVDTEIL